MTRSRMWTAGTAVVVVVVLLVGWLLVISPKKSDASELRGQADQTALDNKAKRAEIEQLEADQKKVPAQNARIATIREQIPSTPQLPQLIRTITAAGNARSVDLESIAPGAIAALEGVEGVSYIPLDVEVHGHFSELKGFIADLEPTDPQLKDRAFLVSGYTITEYQTKEGDDKSAADPDQLTLKLQGRVFLANELVAAPTGTAPTAAAGRAAGTPSTSNAN